jgi:hypothetical protein
MLLMAYGKNQWKSIFKNEWLKIDSHLSVVAGYSAA